MKQLVAANLIQTLQGGGHAPTCIATQQNSMTPVHLKYKVNAHTALLLRQVHTVVGTFTQMQEAKLIC